MKFVFIHLAIFFVLLPALVFPQSCVINFYKTIGPDQKDAFYFPVIKIHNSIAGSDFLESTVLESKRWNDTLITSVAYKINFPTCALIGDGYGHEVIISPGDTVNIFCEKFQDNHRFIRDSLRSPWIFKLSYWGKSKHEFEVFDSLAYIDGIIHYNIPLFNERTARLSDFLRYATEQYQKRVDFALKYSQVHPLSAAALKYLFAEIKYAYLAKLISAVNGSRIQSGDFPKAYLDTLSMFDKNDLDLFENTLFYSGYLKQYTEYFKADIDRGAAFSDKEVLEKLTAYAKLENNTVKDYFAANLIKYQIHKTKAPVNKMILTAFRQVCVNREYRYFIDSLNDHQPAKTIVTYEQVLSSKITAPDSGTYALKDLLKERPVVIDCWASWCGPCIKQMPYSRELEKEYKGRIDFIYLSFDRNAGDWRAKSLQLGINNNYLLAGNFKSTFADYFGVLSIPHYIIIGKNKEIITSDAPMPSAAGALRSVLDKLVIH